MANFLPTLDQAEFRSEGEFTLHQRLAGLDDGFTVIHSLPWLRGRTKRVYSKELQQYLQVSVSKKHLSGEVDFVILHAKLGMLCIETKAGRYKPSGVRFVHERAGYVIDPLSQVKDNTFAITEMLQSWKMKCPVGYAVHFPDFDLDDSQIASAYQPINCPLTDGILISHKHHQDVPTRILQLMKHWKAALGYVSQDDFSREIDQFIEATWPREAQVGHLGRKITVDGELWLRLDDRQASQVALCLDSDRRLIAGFSGSGKTLIARSLAEQFAAQRLAVLFLLKNRLIAQKVASQLRHVRREVTVQTFHSYCESIGKQDRSSSVNDPNYDKLYLSLHGKVDSEYSVLIVDEAQALEEVEHLALLGHFANARKFIFADELQVLPGIEKGSSYRFLEDAYAERFFHLATVYRNPKGVTDAMSEMCPPRHELNCPRPFSQEDLLKRTSWSIPNRIRALRDELASAGVKTQDMIVLSQFAWSLEGIDEPKSTISAFRGMEVPIVFVVAGFEMDDTTLACALGRATTRAYIIVPVEMLAGLSSIKSSFLRQRLETIDRKRVLNKDAADPAPRFVVNKAQRYAGAIGRHEVCGASFAYASRWRRWLYEGGAEWPNCGAQLWGWWLSLSTGLHISGFDPVRNEPTDCMLLPCAECNTVTPHEGRGSCLTCAALPLDEASVSAIALQATDLTIVRPSTRWQSLIRVAAIVGDFPLQSSLEKVRRISEMPALSLATTIIEFRMLREAPVVTKSQIQKWLGDVLSAAELDQSIECLAGRAISSLCARKLILKSGTGRYRLADRN